MPLCSYFRLDHYSTSQLLHKAKALTSYTTGLQRWNPLAFCQCNIKNGTINTDKTPKKSIKFETIQKKESKSSGVDVQDVKQASTRTGPAPAASQLSEAGENAPSQIPGVKQASGRTHQAHAKWNRRRKRSRKFARGIRVAAASKTGPAQPANQLSETGKANQLSETGKASPSGKTDSHGINPPGPETERQPFSPVKRKRRRGKRPRRVAGAVHGAAALNVA